MAYSSAMAAVKLVANHLERLLSEKRSLINQLLAFEQQYLRPYLHALSN